MSIKVLWTNYKIYGIIMGIVLGTIVYNMASIDFTFSYIHSVKNIDFIDSYLYLLMDFLKFYVFILISSFFKVKEKLYTILMGIESFKLAGSIVVFIRMHNMLCAGNFIEPVFKIAAILLFMKNDKVVFNKIIAIIILLLGAMFENILINFL